VDLSRGRAVLLRPGGLPREQIEPITGPLEEPDAAAPAAPGTLASHYAPRAEVLAVAIEEVPAAIAGVRAAAGARAPKIAVLAPGAVFAAWPALDADAHRLPDDVAGMARGLYAALRDLDAAGVDVVIAALPPAAGLGEAVGDRLRRAAGPRRSPS
jgi:L-threonylcarbamoyladenylate synthase